MLKRTTTAQIHAYLANIKWDLFHQFADEFMGVKVDQVQADHNHLTIRNTHMQLEAERIATKFEGLPWDIDLSLTFFRNSIPYDSWLGVQFAREVCRATGATSFCDLPQEIDVLDDQYYWQLSFYPAPNKEILSDLVQLEEVEDNHFIEVNSQEMDLRNFELFHTVFPYR